MASRAKRSRKKRRAVVDGDDDFSADVPAVASDSGKAIVAAATASSSAGDAASASAGANGRPKAGILLELTLVNFMCHPSYKVEFHPRVNFITGRNGSGKSAVAAAICLALGSRASSRTKTTHLGDMIRHGQDTAVIRLTLLNEGELPFKQFLYGSRITIERTIKRTDHEDGKQTVTSKIRFLDSGGHPVKSSGTEVKDLCRHFGIDVDNPLQYMGQEDMKVFTSRGPEELNRFFTMSTGIDEHAKSIEASKAEDVTMLTNMKVQLDLVKKLKGALQEAQDEAKRVESIAGAETKLKEASAALQWASLLEQERLTSTFDDSVERCTAKVEVHRTVAAKLELQAIDAAERAAAVRKDIDRVRERSDTVREQVDDVRAVVDRDHTPGITSVKQMMFKAKADVAAAERRLRKMGETRERLRLQRKGVLGQDDVVEAREELSRRLRARDDLRETEGDVTAALQDATDEHSQAAAVLRNAQEVTREAEKAVAAAERAVQGASSGAELEVAPGVRAPVSRIQAMAGANAVQAVSLLRSPGMRLRAGPVVGPVGATLRLREGMAGMAKQVEAVLGNTFAVFVAGSGADALDARRQLGLKVNLGAARFVHMPPSMTREALMPSVGAAPAGCHWVHDVLDIDSVPLPALFAVAEMTNLSKIVVTDLDDRDASGIAASTEYTVVSSTGTTHRKTRMGVTSATPPPDRLARSGPSLGADDSAAKAAAEARLAVAREEAASAVEGEGSASRAADEAARRLRPAKAARTRLLQDQKRAQDGVDAQERRVATIQARMKEAGEEEDAMAQRLAELDAQEADEREARVQAEKEVARQQEAMEARMEAARPVSEKLARLQAELQAVMDTGALEQQAADLDAEAASLRRNRRVTVESKLEAARQAVEAAQRDLHAHMTKVAEARVKAELDTGLSEAPEAARRGEAACDEVVREVQALAEQGRARMREQGIDVVEVLRRCDDAKRELDAQQRQLRVFQEMRPQMRRSREQAALSLKELTDQVQNSAVDEFADIMGDRGHSGKLTFVQPAGAEGAAPRCEVSVTTHAIAAASAVDATQFEDEDYEDGEAGERAMELGALSGGEKSLTSVAILLAFGASAASPWRMFDEFDVFMDEENRKLAMEMLVFKGPTKGRQVICLTPLDVSSVAGPGRKVHVVEKPVRDGEE